MAPLRNVKLVPFFAFSIFGRQAQMRLMFAIGIFEGDYPRKVKMETVKGKLE